MVLSTTPGAWPQQLYMADTISGALAVFSSGTTPQRYLIDSLDTPDNGALHPTADGCRQWFSASASRSGAQSGSIC